jgi:hypothetical protein
VKKNEERARLNPAKSEKKAPQPMDRGIGRPNLELTSDFAATRSISSKFTLHMEIDDLNAKEVSDLQAAIADPNSKKDRKQIKKLLHDFLTARPQCNYKGGHLLIEALSDNPANDTDPWP